MPYVGGELDDMYNELKRQQAEQQAKQVKVERREDAADDNAGYEEPPSKKVENGNDTQDSRQQAKQKRPA